MSLDHSRLENLRNRAGKLIARCPACAELGEDTAADNLMIWESGAYRCIKADKGTPHHDRIWELVGETKTASKPRPGPIPRPNPKPRPAPRIPPLRMLTAGEMDAIARLRGWSSVAGLELLAGRGLLCHGMVWDGGRNWPAWIITDASRRNAQARRLDGEKWEGINAKAKTLPGSDPSWPIGAADIGNRPIVLLCEGQPDFCAALLVACAEGVETHVAPVCMTGAGNLIHPEALPRFARKHVRIAIHADAKGREAGKRWATQLWNAGASQVDSFKFDGLKQNDGQPVKDLADFVALLNSEAEQLPSIFEGLA